jgi:hypothetical protein
MPFRPSPVYAAYLTVPFVRTVELSYNIIGA